MYDSELKRLREQVECSNCDELQGESIVRCLECDSLVCLECRHYNSCCVSDARRLRDQVAALTKQVESLNADNERLERSNHNLRQNLNDAMGDTSKIGAVESCLVSFNKRISGLEEQAKSVDGRLDLLMESVEANRDHVEAVDMALNEFDKRISGLEKISDMRLADIDRIDTLLGVHGANLHRHEMLLHPELPHTLTYDSEDMAKPSNAATVVRDSVDANIVENLEADLVYLKDDLAEAREENRVLRAENMKILKDKDYKPFIGSCPECGTENIGYDLRAVEENAAKRERARIEDLLGGPYDGTEGLDSFTLAYVIGMLRTGEWKGEA